MLPKIENALLDGIPFLEVGFSNKSLKGYFTSRIGGFSKKPFDSLNLATHVNDDLTSVNKNRDKVKKALKLSSDFFSVNQVHKNDFLIVEKKQPNINLLNFDCMLTAKPDIPLIMFFADCVPIILADPEKAAVGVVHAGWQGTYKKVVKVAVEAMVNDFGSDKQRIESAIGPAIGSCCYQIGEDLVNKFVSYKSAIDKRDSKYYLDLKKVNQLQMIESGIDGRNIFVSDICTSSNADFFSYRRDKGKTGRQSAIAFIRKD